MQMVLSILEEYHSKKMIRLNHERSESQLSITGPETVSHPWKTCKNFQRLLLKQQLKKRILSVFPKKLLYVALILLMFLQVNPFQVLLPTSSERLRGNTIYTL